MRFRVKKLRSTPMEMQNQGAFLEKVVSKIKQDSSSHTAQYILSSISGAVTALGLHVFAKTTDHKGPDMKAKLLVLETNFKDQEQRMNRIETRLDTFLLERVQEGKNPLAAVCHWFRSLGGRKNSDGGKM